MTFRLPATVLASLLPSIALAPAYAPAAYYTFSSIDVPGAVSTLAYDLNDSGAVTGYYQDETAVHGFVFNGGTFSVVDYPGALYITEAMGINNAGQVVGSYQPVGGGSAGFGEPSLPGPARDINNLGQVVGTNSGAGYVYTPGGQTAAITVPGSLSTWSLGINDSGAIVGGYNASSGEHGYLEVGGVYTTLDVPGAVLTQPFGIDDAGTIAGTYVDAAGFHHGFLDDAGTIRTLDYPGSRETEIFGINIGDIVGLWRDTTGGYHGFFAHDPPGDTQVPEPSSLILILTALLLCAGARYGLTPERAE